MRKFQVLFSVCVLLLGLTFLADFIGMAIHARGEESPSVIGNMLIAGDAGSVATSEFSIIREFIGYVREAGVPGLLIVIIYFLWTERKERFGAIDQRLGTLEKGTEEILKRQTGMENYMCEIEEGIRQSNKIAQWAFERDHQVILLLLQKLELSEKDIRAIEGNVEKAMSSYVRAQKK